MRYSSSEFTGISSLLKIDLKLFMIVTTIVFLGMATLFSVSNGDNSFNAKAKHKNSYRISRYDFACSNSPR